MRLKRNDDIMGLNVGFTDAEIGKTKALMEHFKKKYIYELIAELLKDIPTLENTKIKASTKSLGDNFRVRTLRLKVSDYQTIVKYSQEHFREKNNTIRYFVNAAYEKYIEE